METKRTNSQVAEYCKDKIAKAKEKREELLQAGSQQIGYFDWSGADKLIEVEATITSPVLNQFSRLEGDELFSDANEVLWGLCQEARQQTNKSTSSVQNIIDDYRHKIVAEFVDFVVKFY